MTLIRSFLDEVGLERMRQNASGSLGNHPVPPFPLGPIKRLIGALEQLINALIGRMQRRNADRCGDIEGFFSAIHDK